MRHRNPHRRVVGEARATPDDPLLPAGARTLILVCGHCIHEPGDASVPDHAVRACERCGQMERSGATGGEPVLVEAWSPGGSLLRVRSVSTREVWWLSRKNATIHHDVSPPARGYLTIVYVDGKPAYTLEVS